ncbi:hypothetical protein F383_06589 [Gossypium arboreum]|uniref:Uncharacterized protein n=1 Tax=Gossypium arboreum TaxID=29729 RepID=A0A0B0PQ70_GOSAR|nr:hypothetical protein F383_06589 [Gossypium arboreum]
MNQNSFIFLIMFDQKLTITIIIIILM